MQFQLNWHAERGWTLDKTIGEKGGMVTLVAMALFFKVWQPRNIWRFKDEPPPTRTGRRVPARDRRPGRAHTARGTLAGFVIGGKLGMT